MRHLVLFAITFLACGAVYYNQYHLLVTAICIEVILADLLWERTE